jgi:hypothetical protein
MGCEETVSGSLRRKLAGLLAAALLLDGVMTARIWTDLIQGERGFAFGQAIAFALESTVALWLLSDSRMRRWSPLVAALFLLRVGVGVNPAAPAELLYPRTPGADALAARQGDGRVIGLGAALAPDTGMALGVRDARGQDFASLKRYEELVTGHRGDFGFYTRVDALPSVWRLLGLTGLATTPSLEAVVPQDWERTYAGDLLVYRMPGRRALFVPRAVSADSIEVLRRVRAADFDPANVVLLDDGPVAAGVLPSHGTARIVRETSDEVVVETNSSGPGWLLLLDNWFPGWRAEVAGQPAVLRRADYSFRAVEVPGGDSTIRLIYAPRSARWGLALAALAALGLVAMRHGTRRRAA